MRIVSCGYRRNETAPDERLEEELEVALVIPAVG
jgi:hypothetical protein